jgi:hypothetical protein
MDINERQLLNARIAELLHYASVRIRSLTYPVGVEEESPEEEINDLTDLLHNLPRYIVGHDEYAIDSQTQLREAVVEHVKRFYPTVDPAQHFYVQILDMDGEVFLQRYPDHQWLESESVSAATK